MALSAQIQPHFLFNALNTVSGLILEGMPGRAERVTLSLAGLLRRSLESDGREFVPLSEELEAVGRYLEIEEARFEDRFRYVETIPEAMLGYRLSLSTGDTLDISRRMAPSALPRLAKGRPGEPSDIPT